jgi:fatty-acyl-CoA synthase
VEDVVVAKAPSYVSGTSAQPLIGETIGQHFDRICKACPGDMALIARHQDIRWTYAALRERVDAMATALVRAGFKTGDRIGIWSHNNAEWTITQFATAKIGVILVNINPAYRVSELEYVLNKVGCIALVTAVSFKSSRYIDMLRALAPELADAEPGALRSSKLPHLRLIVTIGEDAHPGCLPFPRLLDQPGDPALLEQVGATLQFDDAINIQFTSGTTGSPKGATLSHHNILNNGYFVGQAISLRRGDRLAIPVPLYHCFGMVMGNLACLTHAAAMVYPSEGFDPGAVLEAVQAESCRALYGVPTMFIAMLSHPDFGAYDLSSLQTGIMAGSPCPVEVMRQVVSEMNMAQVTIAYGMTETSPVSFQSDVNDSIERRVSTIGRVHPHLEVKLVDTEGRIVPRGTPGEICTRGYSVMIGYWDDVERTADVLDGSGWMHTGDLGELDDEGFCNIVGRIKDMVIRGGENIYPREIEEFLYSHPAVHDVQVVGVPHPKYGEELVALIIKRPDAEIDAEGIRAFCAGQIAHYKVPGHIRFIDEFPMTVTGKVQKFVLREQLIAEMQLEETKTA